MPCGNFVLPEDFIRREACPELVHLEARMAYLMRLVNWRRRDLALASALLQDQVRQITRDRIVVHD